MTFSIVTPSYQQLDWLRLCVASVRDQVAVAGNEMGSAECGVRNAKRERGDTKSEFQIPNSKFQICSPKVEHIIQDAGSPGIEDFAREVGADFYRDGELIFSDSSSRIQNPKSRYRIAVHCESDSGMYDAINRGFAKATGDVVAYLNCDEQYLEGSLSEVQQFFGKHEQADVVFGDAILVDGDAKAVAYRRIVKPLRMHTRLDHLCTLSCAMFLRRTLIDDGARFPTNYRAIGDAVFVDQLLERRTRMFTTQTPLATYALTGANLSAGATAREESVRWRTGGPYPGWASGGCKVTHRLRRLLAGGYRRRNLCYGLYTFSSLDSRVRFSCPSVGFAWPGVSA